MIQAGHILINPAFVATVRRRQRPGGGEYLEITMSDGREIAIVDKVYDVWKALGGKYE